jgi:metal-sulfur cluster biosynthetic enzyme
MVKKDEIMAALNEVIDPELGMGIVDLGLIYDVDVRPKKKGKLQEVRIRMTFTTPACPMMNEIMESVKTRLEAFEDADIEVSIVFEPLWTIDRLSKKARIKLGLV